MKCKKCLLEKEDESFYKDKYTKSGRKSSCKECILKEKAKKGPKKRPREEPVESDLVTKSEEGPAFDDVPDAKKAKYDSDDDNMVWNGPVETEYPEPDWDTIFDVKEDGDDTAVVISASRRSGKTTWGHDMWDRWTQNYDGVIMFCNSLQAAPYKKFMTAEDRKFAFDHYHPGLLNDIELLQKKTDNAFHFLIYFDDCSSKKFKSSDSLTQLYIRGRNMNCSIVFSTQSPMFVDKDCRANIDYLILMKTSTPNMKQSIVDHFLMHVVPTPKGVKRRSVMEAYLHKWIDLNTDDHNMIVIDFLGNNAIYKYKVDVSKLEDLK